jgi:hypothetical protein
MSAMLGCVKTPKLKFRIEGLSRLRQFKKQNAGQPYQSSVRPTDTFATLIRRPAFASLPRIRPLCVSWSNLNSCMRFWSGLLRPSAALFQ